MRRLSLCIIDFAFGLQPRISARGSGRGWSLFAAAIFFAFAAGPACAADQKISLDGVAWNESTPELSYLRGKTVFVLFYAIQDQQPAEWPAQFLSEVKRLSRNKPLVILAVDASPKPGVGSAYMNGRDFNGPNILHGRDPRFFSKMAEGDEGFFKYILIYPDATTAALGQIGEQDGINTIDCELATKISASAELARFDVINERMPDKVKRLLWPYELGRLPAAADLDKIKSSLAEDERKAIDEALDRYLEAQLPKIRRDAEGTAKERLAAFDRAKRLYVSFRSSPRAEQFMEIAERLYRDESFRTELSAKQAYYKALEQAAAADAPNASRRRLLQAVANNYKSTFYGELAANDGRPAAEKAVRAGRDFTDDEIQAAVFKQEALVKEVAEKIPNGGMTTYATRRFLLSSDIPQQAVKSTYLPCLDAAYTQLCADYGLDVDKNVWRGKAVVVAFADEDSFRQFEALYYNNPKPGVRAAVHCKSDKAIVISCFQVGDSKNLALVLVRETAHGFNWCYRSAEPLPNWLDEGASEWIAHRVVADDATIDNKIRAAVEIMRKTRSMGGDFFTLNHIAGWQYGVAASITDFLMNYEPGGGQAAAKAGGNSRYRKFIDGIKDGRPWEDALRDAYHMDPAQLARAYGQSIGIPDLQP